MVGEFHSFWLSNVWKARVFYISFHEFSGRRYQCLVSVRIELARMANTKNPIVFLDVSIDGGTPGRMAFEVFPTCCICSIPIISPSSC